MTVLEVHNSTACVEEADEVVQLGNQLGFLLGPRICGPNCGSGSKGHRPQWEGGQFSTMGWRACGSKSPLFGTALCFLIFSLNVISWNIRGFGGPEKRKK